MFLPAFVFHGINMMQYLTLMDGDTVGYAKVIARRAREGDLGYDLGAPCKSSAHA